MAASALGTGALARPARAEMRVLVEHPDRVPPRVLAELAARGVVVERLPGDLPRLAAPGTRALRTRRGGRVLEVLVPDDGAWDVRASIPFARGDADESAVRAAEAVRAVEVGSGARELSTPVQPGARGTAALPRAPMPLPTPALPLAPMPLPTPAQPLAPMPAQAPPRGAPAGPWSPWMMPARPARATAPRARPAGAFELGAGAGALVDPTGAVPIVELSGRVWLADALGLGMHARPALATTTLDDATGSASLYGVHAGGALLYAPPWVPERALVIAAEIGAGVLVSRGQASDPYRGVSDSDAGLSAGLRLELRHVFDAPWSLGLTAIGGAVLPPIEVRFTDRARATWGAPFGGLLAGGAFRGL